VAASTGKAARKALWLCKLMADLDPGERAVLDLFSQHPVD